MFVLRLLAPLVALTLAASMALAETRTALVIGNSDYEAVSPLDNPVNDASDLAIALEGLGFNVFLGLDLTRDRMREMARDFGDAAEEADVALLFYAGHGFQVSGRNYLVPVDASIQSSTDVSEQTVAMDEIVGEMERSDGIRLVILDACRDNPFEATGIDVGGEGLARVGSDANFLFAYATQPDNVAYDGSGRNSFFTEALLSHIYTPGQDISDLMISVRKDVLAATGGRQVPWDNSSLTRQFRFDNSPMTASEDTLLWQVAAKAQEPALMNLYLDRYPEGAHAAEVLAFLDSTGGATTATRSLSEEESDAEAARIWALAQRSRLRPLLEYYLENFPDGANVDQARRLIQSIPDPESSTPAGICKRLTTHPRDETASLPGVPFKRLQENAVTAIQACSAAVAQSPDVTHYKALLARATIAAGDIDRAVTLYRQAADGGDLRALVSLAQLYESGTGVPQDPEKALELYERAAEGGSFDAMINLAVTLFQARGDARDKDRAIALLQKAAAGGSAKATYNLGVLAQDGVVGDPSEALGYFEKAARGGEHQGYLAAAILLDEGRGTERNPAQAARMLLLGAAEDDGSVIDQLTANAGQWSTATMKEVQTLLQKVDYYTGKIDGVPGPNFSFALHQWRRGGFDPEVLSVN
ncbi:caspase family protein [Tropicimonas sp. IMCC6043]|uniref:caspase family protein n=1 Tax=Tropicimonas sp. IMCC6043 TaxID=2510645 RepID=UPI00101CC6A5|nr:caspase family protein [Tropicimonas sp. IMCC6043]RYH12266.1 peptidase C14, caspase catalytic subunit p20 [Tropicimonas sp. IMCC6043]